jgi:hypothetical protein
LGLNTTKDNLAQSAMRLRKLGSTQSVVFLAPLEVNAAILDSRPNGAKSTVDSADVLRWLLQSTATSLESLIPLYYANGVNHLTRAQAAWDNWNMLYDEEHAKEFLANVREKDKLSLASLYKPRQSLQPKNDPKEYITAHHLRTLLLELSRRKRAFRDDGTAVQASALEVRINTVHVILT